MDEVKEERLFENEWVSLWASYDKELATIAYDVRVKVKGIEFLSNKSSIDLDHLLDVITKIVPSKHDDAAVAMFKDRITSAIIDFVDNVDGGNKEVE